jgi:hypothetical protein
MSDLGGMLKQVLENGLAPADVAAQVVDAVKRNRFYILTHPEWKEMIRSRMDDILEGRHPTPGFLPI